MDASEPFQTATVASLFQRRAWALSKVRPAGFAPSTTGVCCRGTTKVPAIPVGQTSREIGSSITWKIGSSPHCSVLTHRCIKAYAFGRRQHPSCSPGVLKLSRICLHWALLLQPAEGSGTSYVCRYWQGSALYRIRLWKGKEKWGRKGFSGKNDWITYRLQHKP